MKAIFGPSGIGSVRDASRNLEELHNLGLKACEIAFTYGIYIKMQETENIKNAALKFEIKLSIHAPYWINLNSDDKEKVEQSKKRILACCKIGNELGAGKIVFHPGFYGKKSKEETFENIKLQILEIQEEIKKNKWKVELAPETMGKVNVFGEFDEILNLSKETGCSFTIDFAHLIARSNGKITYEEIIEKLKNYKELHCHFSGIEYGEKGEKKHVLTYEKELNKLLKAIKKFGKNVVIINESPDPVGDSLKALRIWESLD